MMRLFIAVNFSAATKEKLLTLRDELRTRSTRGNFSLPENLHLTLVFLGECSPQQTAAAKAVLDAAPVAPFTLTIDRVGCFRRQGGDIWWAGACENKTLTALQQDVAERLTVLGFSLDNRNFSPHITLGRGVLTECKPWPIEAFGEVVAGIELMKSERMGGKLVYTPIHSKGV